MTIYWCRVHFYFVIISEKDVRVRRNEFAPYILFNSVVKAH